MGQTQIFIYNTLFFCPLVEELPCPSFESCAYQSPFLCSRNTLRDGYKVLKPRLGLPPRVARDMLGKFFRIWIPAVLIWIHTLAGDDGLVVIDPASRDEISLRLRRGFRSLGRLRRLWWQLLSGFLIAWCTAGYCVHVDWIPDV